MSAAPHVRAFCKDVGKSKRIWTIQFPDGAYLKWENFDGSVTMPVWSTESRVKKVMKYEEAFEGAAPISFGFDEFLRYWLPDLLEKGTGLGPNWAGKNLMGWEMGAQELIDRVKSAPWYQDDTS